MKGKILAIEPMTLLVKDLAENGGGYLFDIAKRTKIPQLEIRMLAGRLADASLVRHDRTFDRYLVTDLGADWIESQIGKRPPECECGGRMVYAGNGNLACMLCGAYIGCR